MNGLHAGPTSNHRAPRTGRRRSDFALAARSDACILLTGGPGAARDLAYRLHLASGWRHGAFTVVDCSSGDPALETALLDALSGERPAAPGVVQLRLVQAGTVLLQEVNALPLGVQRRLASRISEQLSSPSAGRSRRRIIASSSERLFPRVLDGTFDDSLYYRLNVIHFDVAATG